ncbi:MAG: DnaJ C-terminal domain-containing protein [Myxococcota bacterium]
MAQDLYALLGVDKNVSPEELKKAFRKLARSHHPDLNPDDPGAEARFREIQEAYAILSDPLRRGLYDRQGEAFFQHNQRMAQVRDPREVFADLLDAFLKREHTERRKGEDLRYHLTLDLEELLLPQEKLLLFPRELDCEACRATGAEGLEGKKPCSACEGLGMRRPGTGFLNFRRPCLTCRGTGSIIVESCKTCQGSGRIRAEEGVRLRIPAGVDNGQRLKVKGKGNQGHRGGEPGELFVIIHIRPHPVFLRQGSELMADLSITPEQAVAGGEIRVPSLEGPALIQLPPISPNGRIFRLRGQGLPRLGQHGRGDLHIRLRIESPAVPGAGLLSRLKDLASSRSTPDS